MGRRIFRASVGLLWASLALGACSDADKAAPGTARAPLQAKGEPCAASSECDPAAPECVDGVCCNTACTGPCVACKASLKESLDAGGTCGPALAGTDPHDSCSADAQTSCGQTGACDGKGACAKYPQGTSCKTQPLQTNQCLVQSAVGTVCSGAGICFDATAPGVPCDPYVCKDGACAYPCAGDADCKPPNRCESGVCKPKRSLGAPCTSVSQCASNQCVDGVCCDAACSGQCQACSVAGSVGTCTVVSGEPVPPRAPCDGSGTCKGTCDGNGTGCSFPSNATPCGAASCTGDVTTPASSCDGAGQCAAQNTIPCAPYGCDAASGQCRTSCSSNSECSQGSVCDTTTQKCATASAICKDAVTVRLPNGTLASCEPYLCKAGKCEQQCVDSGDCAPGFVCQATSCVLEAEGGSGAAGGQAGTSGASGATSGAPGTPGAAEDSGGCGCRLATRAPRPASQLLWLVALLAALRRALRRRRRYRRAWRLSAVIG